MGKASLQLLQVLSVFLEDPDKHQYGLEIIRKTGVKAGTLYPILAGLEQKGWVVSEWEELNAQDVKRPPRRYYKITPTGIKYAEIEIQAALRPIIKRVGWMS